MVARLRPQPVHDHRTIRLASSPARSVGELVERWLGRLRSERSPSEPSYASWARTHAAWAWDLPPETITEEDLRAVIEARVRDGYRPDSLRGIAYGWAALLAEAGIRIRVSRLGLPRSYRHRPSRADVFTPREIAALLRSQRGDVHDRAFVVGLLATGMRVSEWRGVRWGDVDTSTGAWVLIVSTQLHQKLKRREPTKDRATHEHPVLPELRCLLEEVRDRCFRRAPAAHDPLVPSIQDGERRFWSSSTATRTWDAVLEEHGIPRRPPVVARHSFASLIAAAQSTPFDLLAARSITHPASLHRVAERGPLESTAWGAYLHPTREDRVRACMAIRLPPAELADAAQLELPFGENDQ